jgi:hypothetical protein
VVQEVRSLATAARDEVDLGDTGPVVVTGMLAEQLARQLSEGASPGAVIAADSPQVAGSAVLVRIVAGELSADDDRLIHEADRQGVPVVLVQLWPQETWTEPFVRTPFVVECQAGHGFPIPEISARISEAAERPVALARRVPVLRETVIDSVVGTAAVRAAILGSMGGSSRGARPLITLEQVRMLAQLRGLGGTSSGAPPGLPHVAGVVAVVAGSGFLFREAARVARRVLPGPVANAAVAGAATWVVGKAVRELGARFG